MTNQKIFELICKIRNTIFFHGYGHIGTASYMIKPMRIVGKQNIYIGDRCSILNQARMETVTGWEGQSFAGKIVIGNHTSIEQHCHIIAADELCIGDDCVISSEVYIADCGHSCDHLDGGVMNQPLEVKKTRIGDRCFIGTGAKILPGVTLGNQVVVGAGAVVTHDIPDNSMVVGMPARIIKHYDENEKIWKKA